MNVRFFLILLAVVTVLSVKGAEEAADSTDVWSYERCLQYALENNISLRKSELNIDKAEAGLRQAKAAWQPSLDFSTRQGYTNAPFSPGTKNAYASSYGLQAGWTVYNGGMRENNIKREELNKELAGVNTEDLSRSLQTDLLQAYLNLLYSKESIEIYDSASELSKAQAERGKALMEAGRMSRVDYARLASQYESDRYGLVNARGNYNSRRMELKQLLELGIGIDLVPQSVEWSAARILSPLPPMTETFDLAVESDLTLQGLELSQKVADVDIDIAKGGKKPQISLDAGVGTGYNAPGSAFGTSLKNGWNENIGVTLGLPIFDNRKTKTAIEIAKLNKLDAELDVARHMTTLSQEVENWYIDTQSAQSQYEAAESALESARLTNELTDEQFRLGYVNTVELMSAHNNYVAARQGLLQAKYMAILGQKMIEWYRTRKIEL